VIDELPVALTAAEQRRAAEVGRLRASGAAGIEPLLEMLTDPSWAVRRQVVAALARIGDPAVAPLCVLLRTRRDDEARVAAAVDALAATSGDPLANLGELAADPNPAVAADAAQILGRRRDRRAVPLLAQLTAHADDNVAVAAIEALGRVGGRAAVDALLAAAGTRSFFRVFPAVDVLGRSGDPRAIPALARLLAEPVYALEATRALAKTGEAAAATALAQLLHQPGDALVRGAATAVADLHARHTERYGSASAVESALARSARGEQAVRHLVHALGSADAVEKAAVALVLGILGGELAISALSRLLDAGGAVAEEAARSLRRIGPPSEAQVRQALRDGPSARRRALLPVVSRATVTPELLECLSDPDPEVRALAADAAARIGAVAIVPVLFKLLGDRNPRVVQAAIGAIQSLGSAETKALALEATRHPDASVRRAALRIVAYFGFDEGLDAFTEAIRGDDPRLREVAIGGLPFLDDPRAHEALLAAARDASADVRRVGMRAMGHSASTDARLTATLLRGLEDEDPWVRYYAAQALGRIGANLAAEPLARLLGDPAGQVRIAAVEALAQLRSPLSLDALRTAAASGDPDLERAALVGLGATGRREALPILLAAAVHADPATRLVAVSALSGAGSAEVIPALARAARDVDEGVAAAAAGFLAASAGSDATSELVAIARGMGDREKAVALLAVPADGRIASLLQTLDGADEDVAPLLASALARMRTGLATSALFQALASPNATSRKAAASALAASGTREAIEAIRDAAAGDPDPAVRSVCAVLLAE
jgi:HEAT repeat protein